jgi:hypothetical protein
LISCSPLFWKGIQEGQNHCLDDCVSITGKPSITRSGRVCRVYTTAGDEARWVDALFKGHALTAASRDVVLDTSLPAGYGWFKDEVKQFGKTLTAVAEPRPTEIVGSRQETGTTLRLPQTPHRGEALLAPESLELEPVVECSLAPSSCPW